MVVIQRLVPLLSLCLGSSAAFSIHDATDLDSKNVSDACVKAMSANIDCHGYIRSFDEAGYRGSLGNVTETDEVCTSTCSASLKSWFETVISACANEKMGDGVPQLYGGYMWAGWNETCFKDPKTNRYCNDILDDSEELEYEEELCHSCNRRKLEMMQSSSYSIYNSFYRRKLGEVYKKCGGSGPTDIPPPPIVEKERERFCLTKKYYTTKENDTCDSIAKAYPGVAGRFLYMSNRDFIADCRKIPAGIKICLPMTCPIHVVQPDDTCWSIERENRLRNHDVEYFNSWIKSDCSNLHEATDLYGKPICIGAYGVKEAGSWQASIWRTHDPNETYSRIKFSSANGPPIPQLIKNDEGE
ncbi:uncharacterized protein B0J16DRAFT_410583 [Fusarium flagelliforme]|uniref:uncharacterized protein n=1 Tax=Fusarium flagelliforme TaxID=2675880 RepID=UPI001E8CDCF7|nr:uncharacterized protein B0J16DRAFT_410583 [Fusarium flagelliforme]KAH7191800.1 hypothetical protein B0J16DRAFT_410583 [Fusarium flagelliforme]